MKMMEAVSPSPTDTESRSPNKNQHSLPALGCHHNQIAPCENMKLEPSGIKKNAITRPITNSHLNSQKLYMIDNNITMITLYTHKHCRCSTIPILNIGARILATENTHHHQHQEEEERCHCHAYAVHSDVAHKLITPKC